MLATFDHPSGSSPPAAAARAFWRYGSIVAGLGFSLGGEGASSGWGGSSPRRFDAGPDGTQLIFSRVCTFMNE